MSGKMFYLLTLAMVMSLMGNATAQVASWSGEGLWSNAENWNTGTVPTGAHRADIFAGTCVIDETVDAVCNIMQGPGWNAGDAVLNITGGTLTINTYWRMCAPQPVHGEINVSGGQVNVGSWMAIGRVGSATLNISGGTVTANARIQLPWGNAQADITCTIPSGPIQSPTRQN